MVDRQALIDWPLTPYTGWGGYGIQLAQALLEQGTYEPRLLACNDRSPFCDLHWLDALQHLEHQSASLTQQLADAERAGTLPVSTEAALGFSETMSPPRFTASTCGVIFFDAAVFLEGSRVLDQFDLVISGSLESSLVETAGNSPSSSGASGCRHRSVQSRACAAFVKAQFSDFFRRKAGTSKGTRRCDCGISFAAASSS